MKKESTLRRIKALFNLGSSNDSPEEAAAALKKARELMREYGLTEADLSIAEIAEEQASLGSRRRPPFYINALAEKIASHFGIYHFYRPEGNRLNLVFVGFPANREIALYAFIVLSRRLIKSRKNYFKSLSKRRKRAPRIAEADTWARGWVAGLIVSLSRVSCDSSLPSLVSQYIEKNYNFSTKETISRACRKDKGLPAYYVGFVAGQQEKLVLGVESNQETKRINHASQF